VVERPPAVFAARRNLLLPRDGVIRHIAAAEIRGIELVRAEQPAAQPPAVDVSYCSVPWEKEVAASGENGGWAFHHKLRTSKMYPWLMLYLRSDATRGFSGGYHYDTRGMTKIVSSKIVSSLSWF